MNLNRKALRWLYGELPELVAKGVLTPDAAQGIKIHYGDIGEGIGAGRIATIVMAIVGALLVGGGVILLLAHNWVDLSRPTRTVLSFAPLLVAQALAFYTLWTERGTAWREGVGIGLAAAVAASIALVGQTYHIYGELGSFLFVWMLLILPTIYFLNSSAVAAIYLAGITSWAGYAQWRQDDVLLYWPLFALALPHIWLAWRREPFGARAAWLGWAAAIALSVGTGIALEKALPGLWTVIYAAMFATMYLAGRHWSAEEDVGWWRRPFHAFGALGIVGHGLLLTYSWPWNDIGWHYYRWTDDYSKLASVADYLLLVVLLGGSLAFAVLAAMRRQREQLWFGVFPAVAVAAYLLSQGMDTHMPAVLLVNLYLLVLGIAVVVDGIRTTRLGLVNAGMLIVCTLIILRFFDSGFGFIERGIAFIVLGAGFLGTNLVFSRIMGKRKRERLKDEGEKQRAKK
jgi:uncharacterized membrane protein